MAYITQAELESKLGRELTTDEATYFTDVLLPSIQEYINGETLTIFENNTSTDVYVDGTDMSRLIIPTMSTVTAVASVDDEGTETPVDSDAWLPYPRTGPILALTNKTGQWEEGFQNYKITGKLGYTTVPLNIKNVAIEMAANNFNAQINGYKSERVGDWQVTYGDNDYSALTGSSQVALQSYQRLSRSV